MNTKTDLTDFGNQNSAPDDEEPSNFHDGYNKFPGKLVKATPILIDDNDPEALEVFEKATQHNRQNNYVDKSNHGMQKQSSVLPYVGDVDVIGERSPEEGGCQGMPNERPIDKFAEPTEREALLLSEVRSLKEQLGGIRGGAEMTFRGTPRKIRRKGSMSEQKHVMLQVSVPESLRKKFKKCAKMQGVTQTHIMTQLLEKYIENNFPDIG